MHNLTFEPWAFGFNLINPGIDNDYDKDDEMPDMSPEELRNTAVYCFMVADAAIDKAITQ